MVSETLDKIESQINDLQANLLGEHLCSKKCLDANDEMNIGNSILKHKDEIRDISILFGEVDIHLECLDKSEASKYDARYEELSKRFRIFSDALYLHDDN